MGQNEIHFAEKNPYFQIVHAIPNLLALSMIAKIRDTLLSAKSDSNIHPEPTPPAAPNPLLTFSQISESNVSKFIRSSPSKSCDLDPCPTQIVNDRADILAGSITMIINLSLAEGKLTDAFKIAHVTPLLKKTSLHRNELSNYFRPVSGWIIFCFQIDQENRC